MLSEFFNDFSGKRDLGSSQKEFSQNRPNSVNTFAGPRSAAPRMLPSGVEACPAVGFVQCQLTRNCAMSKIIVSHSFAPC